MYIREIQSGGSSTRWVKWWGNVLDDADGGDVSTPLEGKVARSIGFCSVRATDKRADHPRARFTVDCTIVCSCVALNYASIIDHTLVGSVFSQAMTVRQRDFGGRSSGRVDRYRSSNCVVEDCTCG